MHEQDRPQVSGGIASKGKGDTASRIRSSHRRTRSTTAPPSRSRRATGKSAHLRRPKTTLPSSASAGCPHRLHQRVVQRVQDHPRSDDPWRLRRIEPGRRQCRMHAPGQLPLRAAANSDAPATIPKAASAKKTPGSPPRCWGEDARFVLRSRHWANPSSPFVSNPQPASSQEEPKVC